MNKKTIIILIVILITTIIAVGFWYVNNIQKLGMNTNAEKQEKQVVGQNKNQEQKDIEKEKGQTQNKEKQTNQKQSNTNSDIKYNPDGTIDTSDWKTYWNEEFGFEFKYPKKFDLISDYNYIFDAKNISIGNRNSKKDKPANILVSVEYSKYVNNQFKEYDSNVITFLENLEDGKYKGGRLLTKNRQILYPVELYGNYGVNGFIFICDNKLLNILINPNNNMKDNFEKVVKNVISSMNCIGE